MAAKKKSRSSPKTKIPEKELRIARALAEQYTVVLEMPSQGQFRGRSLELPYVMGFGSTPTACVDDVRGSLTVALGSMLAAGESPPSPATEHKRDDQVNIKLTRHEKAFFTQAARREGFRSVADFLRSLAMHRLT